MNRICFGLSLFVLLLMMPNVIAATIFVPDDFPTIQQAIDAASERDTIVVRDGIYYENLNGTGERQKKDVKSRMRFVLESRSPTTETRQDQPISYALGHREFRTRYVVTRYLDI